MDANGKLEELIENGKYSDIESLISQGADVNCYYENNKGKLPV